MSRVYTGEQSYRDFVQLQTQGRLFMTPIRDPVLIKCKLEAMAVRVVADLGPDASWADLKDTLKSRAAGKVIYDSDVAAAALEYALRARGQSAK